MKKPELKDKDIISQITGLYLVKNNAIQKIQVMQLIKVLKGNIYYKNEDKVKALTTQYMAKLSDADKYNMLDSMGIIIKDKFTRIRVPNGIQIMVYRLEDEGYKVTHYQVDTPLEYQVTKLADFNQHVICRLQSSKTISLTSVLSIEDINNVIVRDYDTTIGSDPRFGRYAYNRIAYENELKKQQKIAADKAREENKKKEEQRRIEAKKLKEELRAAREKEKAEKSIKLENFIEQHETVESVRNKVKEAVTTERLALAMARTLLIQLELPKTKKNLEFTVKMAQTFIYTRKNIETAELCQLYKAYVQLYNIIKEDFEFTYKQVYFSNSGNSIQVRFWRIWEQFELMAKVFYTLDYCDGKTYKASDIRQKAVIFLDAFNHGDIIIQNGNFFMVNKSKQPLNFGVLVKVSLESIVKTYKLKVAKDENGFALGVIKYSRNKNDLKTMLVDLRNLERNSIKILRFKYNKKSQTGLCVKYSEAEQVFELENGMSTKQVMQIIWQKNSIVTREILKESKILVEYGMQLNDLTVLAMLVQKIPSIEFRRQIDSDTKFFDFIEVSVPIVKNQNLNDGTEYDQIYRSIHAYISTIDKLANIWVKNSEKFKEQQMQLNYFQCSRVLTRDARVVYQYSFKKELVNQDN